MGVHCDEGQLRVKLRERAVVGNARGGVRGTGWQSLGEFQAVMIRYPITFIGPTMVDHVTASMQIHTWMNLNVNFGWQSCISGGSLTITNVPSPWWGC